MILHERILILHEHILILHERLGSPLIVLVTLCVRLEMFRVVRCNRLHFNVVSRFVCVFGEVVCVALIYCDFVFYCVHVIVLSVQALLPIV